MNVAHYTTSIACSSAPAEAFSFVGDLANLSDWDPGVGTSTQVVGHGPGPNAAYDVTLSNRSMTLRYVTIDFQGPRAVTYEARTPWFTSIDVVSVEPSETGSTVTYDATLRLPFLLRVADPLLGLAFRRIGDAAANGLRLSLDGTFAS